MSCLIVAIAFLVYKLTTTKNDYFKKKGIPFSKPKFLVGSRSDLIFRNKSMPDFVMDVYNEFKNDK